MGRTKKKKKKKDKSKGESKKAGFLGLKDETVRAIGAILSIIVAIFFGLASMELAGMVGSWLYENLSTLFGVGYFILPILFLLVGAALLRSMENAFGVAHSIGALLFFLASLALVGVFVEGDGGIIGGFISAPLISLFDTVASVIILIGLIVISILIIFNTTLPVGAFLERMKERREQKREQAAALREENQRMDEVVSTANATPEGENGEGQKEEPTPEEGVEEGKKASSWKLFSGKKDKSDELVIDSTDGFFHDFTPPPLSILKKDSGKPDVGDIKANANVIKRALHNFGITVEMDEISVGPSVTRYALKPAEGVKLSRIVGLQNDLSLALAAHPLRIEAPIPGKALVGIEIPNTTKSMVGLGTLLGSSDFQNSNKPLLVGLGKSISGVSHFANVGKMPHLLVAGSTGSGKSVTIHSLITSLLFRNSPENLKFIMVDPKRVELTLYNGIPHLLTPVITNPKDAILALKWATKEMDRRYDVLEAEKVRDIESFHTTVLAPEKERLKTHKEKTGEEDEPQVETMPYIVIVIDELADLMTSYPREVEASVVRLAQMSRAVGIHLILSTQRPSVNVITGLIKANIPSRLALQVTSQVDSRTILDTGGAERLLGAGDMLYQSGEMNKPTRIQAPFISEGEVKKIVEHLKKTWKGDALNELDFSTEEGSNSLFESTFGEEDEEEDDRYEEAREIVIANKKASTSFLQRKMKVGYSRAARLIDMLEERSVIGPGEGAKPREVLELPPDNTYNEENDDVR